MTINSNVKWAVRIGFLVSAVRLAVKDSSTNSLLLGGLSKTAPRIDTVSTGLLHRSKHLCFRRVRTSTTFHLHYIHALHFPSGKHMRGVFPYETWGFREHFSCGHAAGIGGRVVGLLHLL